MLVTFDVLKLLKLIFSSEEHPENIDSVFITDDESKWDKSIDIILLAFCSVNELGFEK